MSMNSSYQVFIYMCIYVCVGICACVHTSFHMRVCTHFCVLTFVCVCGQPTWYFWGFFVVVLFFLSLFTLFLRKGLTEPKAHDWARLDVQWALVILLFLSPAPALGLLIYATEYTHVYWGSGFRFLCFCDRHLTIEPSPQLSSTC